MPRFFFNVRHHDMLDIDPEGAEMASIEEARDEAVKAAREMVAEKVARGDLVDGNQFEITTEDGEILEIIPFRSALRLE